MATIYALKPAFQAAAPPGGRPARCRRCHRQPGDHRRNGAVRRLGRGHRRDRGAAFALLGLPLVLLLRMALNAIDGMLAREHGQASRLGFFLNEIGDVVSDAALYLPLMLVLAPAAPLLVGAAVVAIALTEMAGVLGRAAGGSRRYDGPFGKSDRAAYFSILAVAAAVVALPAWLPLAAIAAALALSAVTVVNRVAASLRETGDG